MSNIYFNDPLTEGKVVLHTTVGPIEIELWSKECPLACRNFIQLCLEGYYEGTLFHRLVRDFIVQGGDPTGTGYGGESIYEGGYFKDEFHQRLKWNRRGLIGMANNGEKNKNGSQFFFTLNNEGAPDLNRKNTVFGKVVGSTVYNMLQLNEGDIDPQTEKPIRPHKVTKAEVVDNPFNDIILRPKEKKKKREKTEKKEKPVEARKANLLSFGDEAEDDLDTVTTLVQAEKRKGKSAHDALDDTRLSKQPVIRPGQSARDLEGDVAPGELDDEGTPGVSTIREKLARKVQRLKEEIDEERAPVKIEADDDNMDDLLDQEKKSAHRSKIEKMEDELKKLQKEYKRAIRVPKEKTQEEDIKNESEAIQTYSSMKLNFKKKGDFIKKQADTGREHQTMRLLERFQEKLHKSNRQTILFDRQVELTAKSAAQKLVEDEPQRSASPPPKKKRATAQDDYEDVEDEVEQDEDDGPKKQTTIIIEDRPTDHAKSQEEALRLIAEYIDADDDVDVDDMVGLKFVAVPDDPNVTKAKDANLREQSEDWYDIRDPRNKMNQRRRGVME